jgi:predicted DNA binding CopG/RHH family protein
MKRNHEIRIKLSSEELQQLKKKSEQSNMPLSSLVRYVALNSKIKLEVV